MLRSNKCYKIKPQSKCLTKYKEKKRKEKEEDRRREERKMRKKSWRGERLPFASLFSHHLLDIKYENLTLPMSPN